MNFQEEYHKLMATPIEDIRHDMFFRADNFKGEPWYGEFQIFMALGICQPAAEHALQVRKALKVMGYDTHTVGEGEKVYILPSPVREPDRKPRRDYER